MKKETISNRAPKGSLYYVHDKMKLKTQHPPNKRREIKKITLTEKQRQSLQKSVEKFIQKTFYIFNTNSHVN